MSIMPQGEDLRKAVRWISDERALAPDSKLAKLVSEACLRFDLSPADALYLERWVHNNPDNT